jgi:hypothetical protein
MENPHMDSRIEYLGKSARYGKNEHHIRAPADVPDRALVDHIVALEKDHDSFGTYVRRCGNEAHVYFYTD